MPEAKGSSGVNFQGSEEHSGSPDEAGIISQGSNKSIDYPGSLALGQNPTVQAAGPSSPPLQQVRSPNAVTSSQTGLEHRLAELNLAKSQSDKDKQDALSKYNNLLAEHNSLLTVYKAADSAATTTSRQLHDLHTKLDQTHQQLIKESNARTALAKDNRLLRSQITEMSSAQEPLREEQYYILEFTQIRMDIESWAAKETRNMPKQTLSEQECAQLVQSLSACGETGINAAEWFQRRDRRGWQDRRSRICLIRHFVAVVLFGHVFERFAFSFDRTWSKYFSDMEKLICKNGAPIPSP
jgi:hypothetical protein